MTKPLLTLLHSFLISLAFLSAAFAGENNQTSHEQEQNLPEVNDSGDEFYHSNEVLGQIETITAPTCDNQHLYDKVMAKIQEYMAQSPAVSTIAKRHKALILANINNFSNVPVENFSADEDFNTANALIMIKINKKIAEKDLIVCRQQGSSALPIYLIIYPYSDNYIIHIINLDKFSDNYEDISLLYP